MGSGIVLVRLIEISVIVWYSYLFDSEAWMLATIPVAMLLINLAVPYLTMLYKRVFPDAKSENVTFFESTIRRYEFVWMLLSILFYHCGLNSLFSVVISQVITGVTVAVMNIKNWLKNLENL